MLHSQLLVQASGNMHNAGGRTEWPHSIEPSRTLTVFLFASYTARIWKYTKAWGSLAAISLFSRKIRDRGTQSKSYFVEIMKPDKITFWSSCDSVPLKCDKIHCWFFSLSGRVRMTILLTRKISFYKIEKWKGLSPLVLGKRTLCQHIWLLSWKKSWLAN